MPTDWTQAYELTGPARAQALAEAGRVIAGWGLVMPTGEPLVLHFGLDDFARIGEVEYWIVNDTANAYCGKFLFLFDGQRCPLHHHLVKDETFYIVKGSIDLEVDGESTVLRAGDVLKLAPGRRHTFAAVGGPALVLEVSLPSVAGDNLFADRRIGRDGVL